MNRMRLDCHVHLVGDGSSGSGCWIRLHNPLRRWFAGTMLRNLGLPPQALQSGLDELYLERLLELIRTAPLDAVVLLAQDEPYREDGSKIEDFATFYVPNDHVIAVAKRHREVIAAASIHPARPDAIEELDKCLGAGVRVLKLLPNCLGVDCSRPAYRKFWERMAEGGMILLAHTGGETSLPVLCRSYQDPRILRLPLECGVTVIAAHGAGRNAFVDRHYTPCLVTMMREYPRLYTDNSALVSLNRFGTLKALLDKAVQPKVLHGSDFPIPIVPLGPWLGRLLRWRDVQELNTIKNPLARDIEAKRRMGFADSTFTRMAELLNLSSGSTT